MLALVYVDVYAGVIQSVFQFLPVGKIYGEIYWLKVIFISILI